MSLFVYLVIFLVVFLVSYCISFNIKILNRFAFYFVPNMYFNFLNYYFINFRYHFST